jgi:short-subunit dehydrogenase involved in D-alanine esterification of teichoic acids
MSAFEFKTILIIGATSGIGWALAERFVTEGRQVIISGRRQERLDEFTSKYPGVKSYVFDCTETGTIHRFASTYVPISFVTTAANLISVATENPTLDCVILNAGKQRGFNFARPETVDLSIIDDEVLTNYTSQLHLTQAFLPYLLKKEKASLVYTTSGLAMVPLGRCPNYCATKAALHHFCISLRAHLKDTSVRVIEIMPPAVQTELHDEKYQPGEFICLLL